MTGDPLALTWGTTPELRATAAWLLRFSSPSTRRAYRDRRAEFVAWITDADPLVTQASQIERGHVDAYARHLEAAGRAPATVAAALTGVSSWLTALAGDGVIAANVAAGVKRPAVSPVGVTRDPGRDHVALVVGWCRTRQAGDYGAVVELMARWALRVGEVTALRGRDVAVDSSGAVVLTIKGKGGRPATVRIPPGDPLAARVLQSVAALGLRTLDAPLWQAQQGGKVTTTKVREVLARACHYLQIPTVTPHQLRVFAITASLDAGHNIDDVSTFARHAHVNTTRRYDRNPQRRVDAVAETVTRTLAH